ncbi:MAG: TRAP transporter large permease subunit [Synergistaceae bacterium]|nr:TRAP transporter large permease subunit [Synergistaceae bacterium]
MKRFALVLLTAVLALSLCGASFAADEASPATSGWKFDRPIRIVCPWGEGGGADATLRAIVPLIEKATGQKVEVLNVTGGNGVNGASFTREQPADGYTFMLGTQSLLIQDVMGEMKFKFLDEFVPVARLVHAIDIIATSRAAMEERGFKTFSELRDYIKAHPFSVSVGMLTRVGVDGLSFQQATEGLNILEVDYPTGAGMTAALLAGQIDLMISDTQEIEEQIQLGEIIPMLVLAEKRMNRYPNVESSKELGINAFLGSERGIFAKKGTPQEAIDALGAIIAEAVKTSDWNDFLQQGGYDERPGYAPSGEYLTALQDEYKSFTSMLKPAKPADKKAPAAPSTKLAIIGFVMVLVLIICLIKKIIIPPIAFILLPTIAALVAGFDPLAVNKFAASGISKMVSTVSLFVFSISFFSLMSDQGVFDPIVNFLIKKAGTNVTLVMLATAAVGIIGHLDGSGATTFIITITAMLPLFKKLKMDNRSLMLLVCVAIGVMNVCPWGGPTIRAATVLESDPNILWHRLLPVQGAMLVITFVTAFLLSGIQKRRIAKLGLSADESAEEAKAEDKAPKVSSTLQMYNFLVVVAVIVVLMVGWLNPAYTFMLALAITLPFNIKSLKEQNGKLKNYGVAAMSMVVTLFAAGIFTGVLSGTGMLNAMASAVVTVIPPDLGRYTHFIVACFAVPLIMCLGTDSFYFGLLPVVVGIASQFGVNPMDVACVMLVAENVGVMISPLSPAMYLGLGLLEIEVGEHIKYSLPWIWGISILSIVACIVLGVTPL